MRPKCRYQKCLAIGMRTNLVLDKETRKRRFGKLKKIQEDDTDEPNSVLSVSDESSDEDFQIPSVTKCQEEEQEYWIVAVHFQQNLRFKKIKLHTLKTLQTPTESWN